MLKIEKIDTENKAQVKRFVELPYTLYKDCPLWVPPLYMDAYLPLNRKKTFLLYPLRSGFLCGCPGWGSGGPDLRCQQQAV